MSNEIKPFEFEGNKIRTLADGDTVIFVASDIAKILGYRDAANLTRNLDDDEKGTHEVSTPSGMQNMTILTESGLYRAILNREAAYVKDTEAQAFVKRFQRWVTHEVLPSIRRHGGYMAGQERMTPEQMALTSLKWLQSKVDEQARQLKAQEGKVLFANAVESAKTSILVGDLAKILKGNGVDIGQKRLFAWLREHGWLIKAKGSSWNMPTQKKHGPRTVRDQGDDRHARRRTHHGQQDAEGHRQGTDVLHQPVPQADVGSGCVMDKNMQRAMLSAFDDLRNRLITATQPKTSVDLIDSTFAMSSIGGRGLEQLREVAAAAAVLGQMEAVCRFLLEILYPAGVGEGVDDLLAAESDEIDSLREFPNLGILRGLLDSRGDAGSAGDVSSRLFECLSLCEHDSSPNCSARTSEMRDDTDFRRGPGGSPNAARHHTRKGGA